MRVLLPVVPVNASSTPLVDDDNNTVPFGLNIIEQEEDVPVFLSIVLGNLKIISDTPTVVDDDEIPLIEFESDKDELWLDDRFPENDLCHKAS